MAEMSTYEDYIEDHNRHHNQIADFIGTRPMTDQMESLRSAHNRKYPVRESNNAQFEYYSSFRDA
jgi:hypothetical protein